MRVSINNLRTADEFATLASVIRKRAAGKRVFYAPNGGNWGDALINFGTLQFLQHHNIPFSMFPRETFFNLRKALLPIKMRLAGSILLAGGGGAWCNNYAWSKEFVEHCGPLFDHVIVLPTTFELPAAQMPSDRITYVRRDQYEGALQVPDSIFCHDMAFFLGFDLETTGDRLPTGNFFREDKERSPASILPIDNLDISGLGSENKSVLPFFRILSQYSRIKTDRLHVAIASCLLGIESELFPGNYFKTTSVFRSSIEPNYSSCALRPW